MNTSEEEILEAATIITVRHDKNEARAQSEELNQGVKALIGIIVPDVEYEKLSTL